MWVIIQDPNKEEWIDKMTPFIPFLLCTFICNTKLKLKYHTSTKLNSITCIFWAFSRCIEIDSIVINTEKMTKIYGSKRIDLGTDTISDISCKKKSSRIKGASVREQAQN